MVSKKRLHNIQKIVNEVEQGNFKSSDVYVLLLDLRGQGSKTLDDLANFVHHYEDRDRGVTHDVIEKYAEEKLAQLDTGMLSGAIPVPIFSTVEIIDELVVQMRSMGIKIDKQRFLHERKAIMDAIRDRIHMSAIKLDNARVSRCWLSKERDGNIYLNVGFVNNTENIWPIASTNPAETFLLNCPLFGA